MAESKVEAMDASLTFPLFSSLPAELRYQIWKDALPDSIRPGLYFYKKGCWLYREISQSDPKFSHEYLDRNHWLEFDHSELEDTQFRLPLASVNREARDAAVAWAKKHELRTRHVAYGLEIICPFDLGRDVLYIARDQWFDLFDEPEDEDFGTRELPQATNVPCQIAIAVSEALLDDGDLGGLFHCHHPRTIYVIVDAPAELDLQAVGGSHGDRARQRWQLDGLHGAFVRKDRGEFRLVDGERSRIDQDERLRVAFAESDIRRFPPDYKVPLASVVKA
ncbi:hypothetical protein F5Y10DRAFT_271687 [Nemania abortiva]|nr:hypothetical protein F5Y10DRAFT_271687 [Nemania abortiva]